MIKEKWHRKLFQESKVFDKPSPKPKSYNNLHKNASRTNPLVAYQLPRVFIAVVW